MTAAPGCSDVQTHLASVFCSRTSRFAWDDFHAKTSPFDVTTMCCVRETCIADTWRSMKAAPKQRPKRTSRWLSATGEKRRDGESDTAKLGWQCGGGTELERGRTDLGGPAPEQLHWSGNPKPPRQHREGGQSFLLLLTPFLLLQKHGHAGYEAQSKWLGRPGVPWPFPDEKRRA